MRFKLLMVISLCLVAIAACENGRPSLQFVTPVSPIDRAIAEDLADLFESERVSTKIRLTDAALSEEAALDAVLGGRADVALVSNSLDYRRDVATIMPLYATVLHIAGKNHEGGHAGTEMLRDANVYAGAEGSASRLMFERITERLGIAPVDGRVGIQ